MSIERFQFVNVNDGHGNSLGSDVVNRADGPYVRFSDYNQLAQERDQLVRKVGLMEKTVDSYRQKFFPSVRNNDAVNKDADELGWGLALSYEEQMARADTAEQQRDALAEHLCNCLAIIDGESRVGPDDEARRFLASLNQPMEPDAIEGKS